MKILVSSARGANGAGTGELLAFSMAGAALGSFSRDPRICDPRGLRVAAGGSLLYVNSGNDRVLALDRKAEVRFDSGHIPGLDAGGGNLGPDGRYYVGLRGQGSIAGFAPDLAVMGRPMLEAGLVPFPRGFCFARDGQLYLASGVGPDGRGENTIAAFAADGAPRRVRLVEDPALSPLDLIVGPDDRILVSSEVPFGADGATTTVREYDSASGELLRVFTPGRGVGFRRPRGLRFGPDGNLYCVAQDEVVVFDYERGRFLDVLLRHPQLHGQALEFFEA